MENKKESIKESIILNLNFWGQNIDWKFYSYDYILKDLRKQNNISIGEMTVSIEEIGNKGRKQRFFSEVKISDNDSISWLEYKQKEKNNYFSYIKFFTYDGIEYGLVGGKTNYKRNDIAFDEIKKKNNRYARIFLEINKINWSNRVIIVNHTENQKENDEQQSKFLECYLQRKYNLFDS